MTQLGSHTAAPHVPDGEPYWPFGNWGQVTTLSSSVKNKLHMQ
jgi:hypothetical protein